MLNLTKEKRLKLACYLTNITMSCVACLSPLLFTTFSVSYGISFSLLGLLIFISFFVQLLIDLVFSFFSHKFNIPLVVKVMPLIATLGFLLYSLSPIIFRGNEYIGLSIGTVIFASASGLGEVLISPIIASLPSENPDREMSKLHAVFAWGCVGAIVFGTVLLYFIGKESWPLLVYIFMLLPILAFILFLSAKIPDFKSDDGKKTDLKTLIKNKELWVCVACIFMGGAAECTMSNWASSYLELSLGIDKIWGDIFGFALFSISPGVGRTLYAKTGKNLEKNFLIGTIGASICYVTAALSPLAIIGLLGCAFAGYFVAMLWPGSLVISSERIPNGGLFIYAMMAAGGDLGASVGPQLVGIVTDILSQNAFIKDLCATLTLAPVQLSMKFAILLGALFPIFGILVCIYLYKTKNKSAT